MDAHAIRLECVKLALAKGMPVFDASGETAPGEGTLRDVVDHLAAIVTATEPPDPSVGSSEESSDKPRKAPAARP